LNFVAIRRKVRALLLVMGCHETKMTLHTLHIIGAPAARPGTASRSRLEFNYSVVQPTRRPDVNPSGVMSNPPGGRTP